MVLIYPERKCRAYEEGYNVVGCLHAFVPKRRNSDFCSKSCRATYHYEKKREAKLKSESINGE